MDFREMTLEDKIELVRHGDRAPLTKDSVLSYMWMAMGKHGHMMAFDTSTTEDLHACVYFDMGHFFEPTVFQYAMAHTYWGPGIARILCGIDDFYIDEPVVQAFFDYAKKYAKEHGVESWSINVNGSILINAPSVDEDCQELLSSMVLPPGTQDLCYRLGSRMIKDKFAIMTQDQELEPIWVF